MTHFWFSTLFAGSMLFSVSAAASTTNQTETNDFWSSCIPAFSDDFSLSIPSHCGETISAYLVSFLPTDSTEKQLSDASNEFEQRAYRTRLGEPSPTVADCAIDQKNRQRLTQAISEKLASAGYSPDNLAALINDSIHEQYPC